MEKERTHILKDEEVRQGKKTAQTYWMRKKRNVCEEPPKNVTRFCDLYRGFPMQNGL